jgi:hypothetical protein
VIENMNAEIGATRQVKNGLREEDFVVLYPHQREKG